MHALFEVVYQSQEGRLVTVVHWPELKNGHKPPNANLYLRQRSFSLRYFGSLQVANAVGATVGVLGT